MTGRTWETVHVFISSTFNDMHAEQDYLVKRVVPQFREWCEERRLRLIDIDLRWGVTEPDALHHGNVVKVCLDRIDECRPFFICLLGQRRGWVPRVEDVSRQTLESFPELRSFVGTASVTEFEILHAVVGPLHGSRSRRPSGGRFDPAEHAYFYLRDLQWLDQQCREADIPRSGRPVRRYQASWDPDGRTLELLRPLQCPSRDRAAVGSWQRAWERVGIPVSSPNLQDDPALAEGAADVNRRLTRRRLAGFRSDGGPRVQQELDQQEEFLLANLEGFVGRGGDFDTLDSHGGASRESWSC
jgi:hypothetical protein